MTLRMLDLFAGIGGFSYAGEKLVGGYETVAFCEYDQHAQKVLRKHWPHTEIIGDIRDLANDAERFRGSVDIVCGGYPCQPFSLAGVRRGDQDDRHLWPEMLRVIEAVRPRWIIGENVAGHITMGLDTVLSDLEAAGYTSRCYVIPAVAADAPHRRDRCWIVANAGCQQQRAEVSRSGSQSIDGAAQGQRTETRDRFTDGGEAVADADCVGSENQQRHQTKRQVKQPYGGRWWEIEPAICRVDNGIPGRVHRLKQLGNSIVPQVAARILYAIKEADNE
jgi:DNA (cytosine-5)-methyltransferase 1